MRMIFNNILNEKKLDSKWKNKQDFLYYKIVFVFFRLNQNSIPTPSNRKEQNDSNQSTTMKVKW